MKQTKVNKIRLGKYILLIGIITLSNITYGKSSFGEARIRYKQYNLKRTKARVILYVDEEKNVLCYIKRYKLKEYGLRGKESFSVSTATCFKKLNTEDY